MSIENAHYVNMFFGASVILLQALTAVVVLLFIFSKENKLLDLIKKYFVQIGFFISLSGLLVSTFYSEVLNYLPCFHCWVQRIFMFPQTLLYGVAWWRKDRNVLWYSLSLLVFGLADAIYLIYLYYFNQSSAPCDASGVSCALHYVSEFSGYISIPTMSISGFIALLVLVLVAHFYKKE